MYTPLSRSPPPPLNPSTRPEDKFNATRKQIMKFVPSYKSVNIYIAHKSARGKKINILLFLDTVRSHYAYEYFIPLSHWRSNIFFLIWSGYNKEKKDIEGKWEIHLRALYHYFYRFPYFCCCCWVTSGESKAHFHLTLMNNVYVSIKQRGGVGERDSMKEKKIGVYISLSSVVYSDIQIIHVSLSLHYWRETFFLS